MSSAQMNDNLFIPSAREMTGVIDVHSHLVIGFDNPFMPGWTIPPAILDIERWNGFGDTDLSSIAHRNAESLYPALTARLQRTAHTRYLRTS